VLENFLRDGACPSCGWKVPGRWDDSKGPAHRPPTEASRKAAKKYEVLNLE